MSYLTIYFENKPVFLSDNLPAHLEELARSEGVIHTQNPDAETLASFLEHIHQQDIKAGIILGNDWQEIKQLFFQKFTLIAAGGGIIRNREGAILLIFRYGKWDLPKGKLDEGESIEACSVREVKEETGLREVDLLHLFGMTYHTYIQDGKSILKETHWYLMEALQQEKLTPQLEEDISEARWVPPKELPNYYALTYPAIADMLRQLNIE